MSELIYPELSYQIVGLLYETYNKLGFGYQEKYYQRAFEKELQNQKIKYSREAPFKIKYKGESIGKYYVDFIIDGKVAVELKVANDYYKRHLTQVLGYLKSTNLKLGIIAIFTEKGLKYKRIAN